MVAEATAADASFNWCPREAKLKTDRDRRALLLAAACPRVDGRRVSYCVKVTVTGPLLPFDTDRCSLFASEPGFSLEMNQLPRTP